MKKGSIDLGFTGRMLRQEHAAEQSLQGLLWSSSGSILPEGPETPAFNLAPEEELDFGGY